MREEEEIIIFQIIFFWN